MRASIVLVALLVLSAAVPIYPVIGQVVVPLTPSLGMGFSPGTVSPTVNGVPVFTSGDQLWVEAYSSSPLTVQVADAAGTVLANAMLLPMSVDLLYSFSSADIGGSWGLLANTPGSVGPPLLTTSFTFVGNQSVQPSLTGYLLTGRGGLNMNFSLAAPGAYDIGACLIGSSPSSTVEVPLPSGLGIGDLGLAREGDQVVADLNGTITAPFTFWTELQQTYSYALGVSSTVVSRNLDVASSEPVDATLNFSGATTMLDTQLNARTGRSSMWTYFESAQGLSVYQAPVLIPNNDTWVSLQGCSTVTGALAPTFSLSASLTQPPASWPRGIFTMYKVDGVEMFSVAPIPIQPAVIRVLASPWNQSFTNPDVYVVGSVGNPLQRFSVGNDTIYITAGQYPQEVVLDVSGDASGVLGSRVEFTVSQPFSTNVLDVASGKVVVETNAGGKPVSGANVVLEEQGGQAANATSVGGKATFYVLPGNYTVAGSFGNSTATGVVDVLAGSQSALSLDFGGSGQFSMGEALSYLLAFTAVAGVAISIFVWFRAYRTPEVSQG